MTTSTQTSPRQDDGVDRDRILHEFEAALQANREMDAGEREEVMRQFRDAMDSAPVDLVPPDLDKLQADFRDTLQRLVEMGIIDNSETGELVQEFGDSLQPLRDPAFVKSQEYLRRLREDGEQAATEWLRSTQATSDTTYDAILPAASLPLAPAPKRRRRT